MVKRESPLSSDFSCIARDITIDLNGYTLASDEEVDWFEGEFIKIELQYGRSFKLQNGTVTGAKSQGAVRIAAVNSFLR